jgi:hypothetical protein
VQNSVSSASWPEYLWVDWLLGSSFFKVYFRRSAKSRRKIPSWKPAPTLCSRFSSRLCPACHHSLYSGQCGFLCFKPQYQYQCLCRIPGLTSCLDHVRPISVCIFSYYLLASASCIISAAVAREPMIVSCITSAEVAREPMTVSCITSATVARKTMKPNLWKKFHCNPFGHSPLSTLEIYRT